VVTRRQLLTRAGLAAAGLPVLARSRAAHAAGPPLRLILWPCMNGAEAGRFFPANLTAMSSITEPLKEFAGALTFVRGVDIAGSFNHFAVRSIFSGAKVSSYESEDPALPSMDQVVADHFQAGAPDRLRSLHLGVIPADSIAFYQRAGRSTFFFAPKPVDYEANPVTAYDRLLGGMAAPMGPAGAPPASFTGEMLDLLEAEVGELSARARDATRSQAKLTQHGAALRALRPTDKPIMTMPGGPALGPLASVEKLRAALQDQPAAAYKHQYFSDIFDAQIDILTRAVVSGQTRVATIQAGSADGNAIVPVGRGYPHHNTSHGNQDTFSMCVRWYMTKFQRMLQALNVPDPLDPAGKTVLFNSVVVFLAECLPVSHASNGVPCLIAGNAGGALKGGQIVNATGATNKSVLRTLLTTMGVPTPTPQFDGPLIPELRG
jgi:hypothetical protein